MTWVRQSESVHWALGDAQALARVFEELVK